MMSNTFEALAMCDAHPSIWVNYNDLTTTSLEIMVSKGNHPQMALIQVGEILFHLPRSMHEYIGLPERRAKSSKIHQNPRVHHQFSH